MFDRADIVDMLRQPDIHAVGGRAHRTRRERFGQRSSFAAVEHVAAVEHAYCSICGQRPTQRRWLQPDLEGASELATELHVLVSPGASQKELLAAIPQASASASGIVRTPIVGVAADWIRAAGADASTILAEARDRGLRVLSDGVLPAIHPARGSEMGELWSVFWTAAAEAGMRGFASVFYGPGHDEEALADQLEAIAAIQRETEVFYSACPMVDPGSSFGGLQDSLLTQGDADLRVLAACRVALGDVEHLTLLYDRCDLKMAHIALLGGVDDLCGHLALEARGLRDDANHDDLSFSEMESWMRGAGMEACLRNACFEFAAP